jgi:lipid-A-disaccharide synthase
MRIALVAGEASGDRLGAGLIAELRQRFPDAEFAGVGGPLMQSAGLQAWYASDELAVMGLAEVLRHLPRLLVLRRKLRQQLLEWRPDVFIGIDAPDFNLGLERQLRNARIRTVHYVSPSVWAWRESRVAKIGRSADLVLCLFPMEPPIYARHSVNARFVGHPLADEFAIVPDTVAARRRLALPASGPVLAMLPGSRIGEIRRLLPVFLETAKRMTVRMPDLIVTIPAANAAGAAVIDELLKQFALDNVRRFDGRAHECLLAADVVLLASGTAALEAMLAKRPMVVAYRLSKLTYHLVMTLGLMKVNRYSLPNILANEPVVPELMQDDCTAENLMDALLHWLQNPAACAALQPRFAAIHQRLRLGASARAADAIADLLAGRAINAA